MRLKNARVQAQTRKECPPNWNPIVPICLEPHLINTAAWNTFMEIDLNIRLLSALLSESMTISKQLSCPSKGVFVVCYPYQRRAAESKSHTTKYKR